MTFIHNTYNNLHRRFPSFHLQLFVFPITYLVFVHNVLNNILCPLVHVLYVLHQIFVICNIYIHQQIHFHIHLHKRLLCLHEILNSFSNLHHHMLFLYLLRNMAYQWIFKKRKYILLLKYSNSHV